MKKGGFQAMMERGREAMAQRQAQAEARRAEQRQQEAQPGGNLEGTPRDLSTPGPAVREPQLPFGGFFTPKSSPHPTGGDPEDTPLVMSLRKDLETERGRRLALLSEMEDSEQAAMAALKSVKARAEDIEKQRVELETELRVAKAAAEVFEAEKAKHAEAEARNAALEAQNAQLQQQVTAAGGLTEEVQPRGDATKLATELRATQEERRILREQMASMQQALDGAGRDTDARLREQEAAHERLAAEKAAAEEKLVEMAAAQVALEAQVAELQAQVERAGEQIKGAGIQVQELEARLRGEVEEKRALREQVGIMKEQIADMTDKAEEKLKAEIESRAQLQEMFDQASSERQAAESELQGLIDAAVTEKAGLASDVKGLRAECDRLQADLKEHRSSVEHMQMMLQGAGDRERALQDRFEEEGGALQSKLNLAEAELQSKRQALQPLEARVNELEAQRQQAERVADQLRGETKTLLAKMGNQLEMLQDVEQERDLLVQLLRAERETQTQTKTNRVAGTPSSNARPVAK